MSPTVALVRFEGNLPSEPYIQYQAAHMERYGCQFVSYSNRAIGPISSFLAPFLPRWSISVRGIDIVHSHFGPDALYGAALARHANSPHVVSLHGYDVCYPWHRYLRLKRPRFVAYAFRRVEVLRRADLILCCSEYLRQRAISLGVPAEKIRVHHLGVDLAAVTNVRSDEVRICGSIPHVVCVGRLVPIKGQEILIRAIPLIRKALGRVRVTLVGDGPSLGMLKRLAARLLPDGDLCFTGNLSHEQSLRVMASASAVVVPSRSQRSVEEAFGLVAAEAMALGVPVVATRTGGLTELLEGGALGVLVPADSPEALADGVIAAIREPDAVRLLRAQQVAQTLYDAKHQLKHLEGVFDEVIRQAREVALD